MLSNTIALVFVWIFSSAGVSKLRPSHQEFYLQTLALPGSELKNFYKVLIYCVGFVEVAVSVALIVPTLQTFALFAASGLLVVYTLYILLKLTRGQKGLPCGCSGPNSGMTVSGEVFLRNLVLCGLAFLAALNSGAAHSSGLSAAEWCLCLAVAAIQILVLESVNQLISSGEKIKQLQNAWNR